MIITNGVDQIETTEKDFLFYIAEFKRYQRMFNLMDWEVNFQWEEMNDCRACIQINVEGKCATTAFNKLYDCVYDDAEVSKCAFHECWELMLGCLTEVAERRFTTRDEIEQHTHTVIRTMENVFWEKDWEATEKEKKRLAAEKKKKRAIKNAK